MPKRMPKNDMSFDFGIAKPEIEIEGVLQNGAPGGDKAFIAFFKFYDADSKLIAPPYPRLSYSKVGAYKYLAGGSADMPMSFKLNAQAPSTAKKLELVFSSWEQAEKPAFIATPSLNNPAPKTTAPEKTLAQRMQSFSLAAQAEHFLIETTRPISGYAGEWLELSDTPVWMEFDAHEMGELVLSLKVQSDTRHAKSDAMILVRYLDVQNREITYDGLDLARSSSVGPYKYIPCAAPDDSALVRLFVPHGCVRVMVGFRRWKIQHRVTIQNNIHFAGLQRGISVIVPCYKAEDYIEDCLTSLARQTFPGRMFEAIFVLNGPEDNTRALITDFQNKHPDLCLRVATINEVGAGAARNRGLALAGYCYTAFLDADDMISPEYLDRLLDGVQMDRLALAQIVDVMPDGQERADNAINNQILKCPQETDIAPEYVSGAVTMIAAKLVPTYYAKQKPFDVALRSGEDVCFFTDLLIGFPLTLRVVRHAARAIYYRRMTANSVSRQAPSYDFNVTQRLAVMRRLDGLLRENPKAARAEFIRNKIRAQMAFLADYCAKHPKDYARVIVQLRGAYLSYAPLHILNAGAAQTLVIAYCFPPYMDTSAIVMAKRMAEASEPFDVIYNQMTGLRDKDASLNGIASDYQGRSFALSTPSSFTQWEAMAQFTDQTIKKVEALEKTRAPYKRIYSRAMFPAAHFAGAAFKARQPDVEWVAEFSDPLLYDIKSQMRYAPLARDWLKNTGIMAALAAKGIAVPSDDNLFLWCEFLPYALADRLIFTNENQKNYMIGAFPMKGMAALIEAKAEIVPQPTPPSAHYHRIDYNYYLDPTCVHLAFFGSIYETRGLTEIFDQLAELDPKRRAKIRFHVFSQQFKQITKYAAQLGLQDVVVAQGYIGYFEHLNLLTKMDVLVINDAATIGIKPMNPYLPSKLSDYAGSGSKIWGIIERGSPLDQSPALTYRSILGSRRGYATTLEKILKTKQR